METDLLGAALALADSFGWRVVPLHGITEDGSCDCGDTGCKSPGKHPRTVHGVKQATTDAGLISQWWNLWPNSNIGVATGKDSGIFVVDYDKNKSGDDRLCGMEAFDQDAANFTEVANTLQIRSGSGGRHAIFQYPAGVRIGCRNKINHSHVDVRGDGGYIIAPPSLHHSGSPYQWAQSGAILEASEEALKAWDLIGRPEEDAGNDWERGFDETVDTRELQKINEALSYIRPLGDDWLKGGMALHDRFNGSPEGFHIWRQWSRTAAGYENEPAADHWKRWLSFGRHTGAPTTLASIYDKAGAAGWVWVPPNGEELVIFDIPTTPDADPDSLAPTGTDEEKQTFSVGRFPRVPVIPPEKLPSVFDIDSLPTEAESLERAERFWRDHVLFRGAVFLIAGEPKIGKSAFFLAMAIAASSGGEFLGYKFRRPLRVLWLQAEIHEAFLKLRVESSLKELEADVRALVKENFRMTGRLDLSLTNDTDYARIANMVREFKPDILCIDPIINFSEANENDNSEVRALIRRVLGLTEVEKREVAVVLCHHVRKGGGRIDKDASPFDLIRGASAFRGAYDSGVVLARNKQNEIEAHYETRNGPSPDPVCLVYDPDGNHWISQQAGVTPAGDGTHTALALDEIDPPNSTFDRYARQLFEILAARPGWHVARADLASALIGIRKKEGRKPYNERSERRVMNSLKDIPGVMTEESTGAFYCVGGGE